MLSSWFSSSDSKQQKQPTTIPPPPPYTDVPESTSYNTPRRLQPLDLPCLNALRGKRVILASASPRRKQLLAQIGLTNLEIVPSDFPEDLDKEDLGAFAYVAETATQKCLAVYKKTIDTTPEPTLVIAADTVICSSLGSVIEKPLSHEDHVSMLKELRDGDAHRVFTAVTVMSPLPSGRHPGYALESHVEQTLVRFDKNVTDDLIESYVRSNEGRDKAGGYAIQGMGAILVESIEGGYDNVVGLPLRGTLKCIEEVIFHEKDEQSDSEDEDGGGGILG